MDFLNNWKYSSKIWKLSENWKYGSKKDLRIFRINLLNVRNLPYT